MNVPSCSWDKKAFHDSSGRRSSRQAHVLCVVQQALQRKLTREVHPCYITARSGGQSMSFMSQCCGLNAHSSVGLTSNPHNFRRILGKIESVTASTASHRQNVTSHLAAVTVKAYITCPALRLPPVSKSAQRLANSLASSGRCSPPQGVGMRTSRSGLGDAPNPTSVVSPSSSSSSKRRELKVQATATREGTDGSRPEPPKPPASDLGGLQRLVRLAVKQLSSFPLAIALLAVIAALCAVGR